MFGLIGKRLGHSFSPEIHHLFGNEEYQLFETDDLASFLSQNHVLGANVTIPYKTDIIPFLDDLDLIALATMSVNTIVRKNNKLIGYNTDYDGLKSTLSYYQIDITNKNVLILGNGSVSKTVVKLMQDLNAKQWMRLGRKIKSSYDRLFSDNISNLPFDIIINTTPVGMYPNNQQASLIDFSKFKTIECYIDLIYNPLRPVMLIEAQKHGIFSINGLYMLVMQAKRAHELFFDKNIPLNYANKIYKKILHHHSNLVFVGLPLSGKSKYARIFGELFDRSAYDIDEMIEKDQKKKVSEIFEDEGEPSFRQMESNMVKTLYQKQGIIISTGGGLIENSESMSLLKQNGIIIFLNKNPMQIAKKKIYGRPLLNDPTKIISLAKRRLPLYQKHADIVIDIKYDTETHINEIKEKIDEYFNNQRP